MDMDRSNYMLGSSRKFGKLKRCKTIGGDDQDQDQDQDRISGLPDVILSHILNSLTLKEAAATSILSKRWKNLWTWSPNLDFTSLNANHVNKILEQHNMPKLHKLKIWLHTRHDVDDWISIALRKAVSEIELYMCNLRADGTLLNGGEENGIPFESLTHLYLVHVDFPDQVFDLILSKCSSLENFHLKVNNGLVNAISSTTRPLKLKSLELYLCKHLEYVQLSAPNLMTFIYQGRHRALCIKDANHLASLSLLVGYDPYPDTISTIYPRGKSFLFSQFSSYLPKLESLVISANLFEGMIDFTELNVFSNLKQLKLKASCTTGLPLCYKVAASIIRVAPYLELFEIFLLSISHRSYDSSEALELTSMPANQNFKEVKLYGFRGDKYTMKFLAYLVEHAISLQKIDINARGATLSGGKLESLDFRLDWNKVDAEHSKNCVLQLRQSLSHSNVQLLFHDG